jgi:ABC-type transport system involved in multi-copper enzyme maturation permease subunit
MMNNIFAISGVVIKELYRRKDFYVLFILTALITLLMGSVNFFSDDKIVRYVKEISLLLIWISSLVIAIGTAARQIPSERENRTIFPLLAKPVSRAQVVFGKFLGCWLACGIALVVFYVFFGIVCAAREHSFPAASYAQALTLHWMLLGVIVALTLLGSVVLSPAANVTICFLVTLAILLVGRHLNTVASQLHGLAGSIVYAVYFAIPHLEFFDIRDLIIHNWEPVPWSIWFVASLYGAAYTAFFLGSAWVLFRRKALN